MNHNLFWLAQDDAVSDDDAFLPEGSPAGHTIAKQRATKIRQGRLARRIISYNAHQMSKLYFDICSHVDHTLLPPPVEDNQFYTYEGPRFLCDHSSELQNLLLRCSEVCRTNGETQPMQQDVTAYNASTNIPDTFDKYENALMQVFSDQLADLDKSAKADMTYVTDAHANLKSMDQEKQSKSNEWKPHPRPAQNTTHNTEINTPTPPNITHSGKRDPRLNYQISSLPVQPNTETPNIREDARIHSIPQNTIKQQKAPMQYPNSAPYQKAYSPAEPSRPPNSYIPSRSGTYPATTATGIPDVVAAPGQRPSSIPLQKAHASSEPPRPSTSYIPSRSGTYPATTATGIPEVVASSKAAKAQSQKRAARGQNVAQKATRGQASTTKHPKGPPNHDKPPTDFVVKGGTVRVAMVKGKPGVFVKYKKKESVFIGYVHQFIDALNGNGDTIFVRRIIKASYFSYKGADNQIVDLGPVKLIEPRFREWLEEHNNQL